VEGRGWWKGKGGGKFFDEYVQEIQKNVEWQRNYRFFEQRATRPLYSFDGGISFSGHVTFFFFLIPVSKYSWFPDFKLIEFLFKLNLFFKISDYFQQRLWLELPKGNFSISYNISGFKNFEMFRD
jgi:hypothetical protein